MMLDVKSIDLTDADPVLASISDACWLSELQGPNVIPAVAAGSLAISWHPPAAVPFYEILLTWSNLFAGVCIARHVHQAVCTMAATVWHLVCKLIQVVQATNPSSILFGADRVRGMFRLG